jgi:hypothetical protein
VGAGDEGSTVGGVVCAGLDDVDDGVDCGAAVFVPRAGPQPASRVRAAADAVAYVKIFRVTLSRYLVSATW